MSLFTEPLRTLLFVPGSRPERFDKALAAGADTVIIDLEDAVEADAKAAARDHIQAFARRCTTAKFMIRVNACDTPWFDEDLALCASLEAVSAIVLPKAQAAADVQRAAQLGKAVVPLIESPQGVLSVADIAKAPLVACLAFGTLDFMLDVGADPHTPAADFLLEQTRCTLLLHSVAAGLAPPIDGVYPDFNDSEGLQQHARHIGALGFGGVLCIHPRQVEPVHQGLAPSKAQRLWAQQVVDAAKATDKAAFQLEGQMIDAPVIKRAHRVLARAQ